MRVVFTGPATGLVGERILREDLTEWANDAGHVVMAKIDKTVDLLVASRGDTVKAKTAEKLGVKVIPYYEFVGMLQQAGVQMIPAATKPDLWVDLPMELTLGYDKPAPSSTLRLLRRVA